MEELVQEDNEGVALPPAPGEPQIGKEIFTFDYAYENEDSTFSTLYDDSVNPLVERVFKGHNATILAYGQRGSGKTHTMGTNYSAEGSNQGILLKVMDNVFQKVERMKELTNFCITVSFIEVLEEQVFDLLDTNPLEKIPIQIRETMDSGGITLCGVTETVVRTKEEMGSCLAQGCLSRATENTQSSRSHAIFTIIVNQQKIVAVSSVEDKDDVVDGILCAKFHLVDLAGCVDDVNDGNDIINKDLLALANVISALGDEKIREGGRRIPYGDSKLTQILQDSLGGNNKTLMIACVCPPDKNTKGSLVTLKYANYARRIQNNAIINRPVQVILNLIKICKAAQDNPQNQNLTQLMATLAEATSKFEASIAIYRDPHVLWSLGKAKQECAGLSRNVQEVKEYLESGVLYFLKALKEKILGTELVENPPKSDGIYETSLEHCAKSLLKFHVPSLREFSFETLREACQNFSNYLGKGTSASVYRGRIEDQEVAVKIIEYEDLKTEFITELIYLSRADHKNIVKLVGYCIEKEKKLIAYEMMTKGTVTSNLPDLSWSDRLRVACDVANAVDYLHNYMEPRISHGDLKPDNILLTTTVDGVVSKIGDFGKVKIALNQVDLKRDLSRFGYFLMELLTGRPAWILGANKFDVFDYVQGCIEGCLGEWALDDNLHAHTRVPSSENITDFFLLANQCRKFKHTTSMVATQLKRIAEEFETM